MGPGTLHGPRGFRRPHHHIGKSWLRQAENRGDLREGAASALRPSPAPPTLTLHPPPLLSPPLPSLPLPSPAQGAQSLWGKARPPAPRLPQDQRSCEASQVEKERGGGGALGGCSGVLTAPLVGRSALTLSGCRNSWRCSVARFAALPDTDVLFVLISARARRRRPLHPQ